MSIQIQVPVISPAWLAQIHACQAILQPVADNLALLAAHLPVIEFVPVPMVDAQHHAKPRSAMPSAARAWIMQRFVRVR